MARPRPPPLYRLSRIFRLASVVMVIIIIAYLGVAVSSLLQLQPSDVSGVNSVNPSLDETGASLAMNIEVKNPGLAPVNSVAVNFSVQLENHTLIANGGLPTVQIAPSGTGRFPFSVNLTFAPGGAAEGLLFNDHQLWIFFGVNATYAYLFMAHVGLWGKFSWGAPFFGYTSSVGTPTNESNGSVLVPVTVSFTNHARFGLTGNITTALADSAGVVCSTTTTPIPVPAGAEFNQTIPITATPACLSTATTVQVTWVVGPHLTIVLNPEPLH